jgi:hypothetical protein
MAKATFVDIPAIVIVSVLDDAGFEDITDKLPRGKYGEVQERVFARSHHTRPNVQIRVYTSIDKRTNQTRGDSEDRIMVCAFYTKGDGDQGRKASQRFLFGATGVNRASGESDVGEAIKAIMGRLLERMREVYGRVGKAPKCPKCGEPIKQAKSRKKVLKAWRDRPARINPNYKRAYEACMDDSCDFFRWVEPQGGAAAKPAPSQPEAHGEARKPEARTDAKPEAPKPEARKEAATDPAAQERVERWQEQLRADERKQQARKPQQQTLEGARAMFTGGNW